MTEGGGILENWVEVVDELGISFVLFELSGKAIYLSSSAARLFNIRHRDELEVLAPLFAPLVDLYFSAGANFSQTRANLQPARERVVPPIQEVSMFTLDGAPLKLIVTAHRLNSVADRILVELVDVRFTESLIQTLNGFRRSRPGLILASIAAKKPIGELEIEDLAGVSTGGAGKFTPGGTRKSLPVVKCDLARAITSSIDTVDPVVSNTFKIVNEVSTSALLAVPEITFISCLVHLFLEASELVGVFGKVRVVSRMFAEGLQTSGVRDPEQVLLGLFCSSLPTNSQSGSLVDRYLRGCLSPTAYRVSHKNSIVANSVLAAEEDALISECIGPESVARVKQGYQVSPEHYSENFRTVEKLAKQIGCQVGIRLLGGGEFGEGEFLLRLVCPLIR